MRCFGRAFAFEACVLRPLDLMALRAELLPAPPRPVHFFFTAGCAADRDGAFCLAMYALPFFVDEKRLAQNWKFADFVGWGKARLRRATFACSGADTWARFRRRAEARKSEGGINAAGKPHSLPAARPA